VPLKNSGRIRVTFPVPGSDTTPGVNRATVNDLLTCRFIGEAAPVHIVGPVGTGKSHLAQAIGHQAVRLGHDVFFATQSQLFGSLTRARLSGVHERRMKMLAKVAVLVIDDFALKPIASPHDDDLHEIVAARYEKLPTVITSNLASEEWQEAFSNNKMLGLATVDRLMHGAYCGLHVVLCGKPRPQLGAASANGLAGRCLSLDMRR